MITAIIASAMRLGVLLCVLSVSLVASEAHAQLDEGRRRLEHADFTRAVRAFDRAERGAHLTRDQLLSIYEGRAMARWAQGNERQAQHDLIALAEVDPHHAFPPEAPPELGEAFADAARDGGLSLQLSFVDAPGSATLTVDTHHDDAGLVRALRTHVRVADGAWTESDSSTVRLDVAEHAAVEAWVEAIGPGGAVIATSGSEGAPIVHGGGPIAELQPPTPMPAPTSVFVEPSERHDDTPLWIGIGVGIAALVVAAVIICLVVGTSQGPSDQTQPDAPVVRF